jgi:hypothetical protein
LHEKRRNQEGIYQATAFKHVGVDSKGLKRGSYFLSLEACQAIEAEARGMSLPEVRRVNSVPSSSFHSSTHPIIDTSLLNVTPVMATVAQPMLPSLTFIPISQTPSYTMEQVDHSSYHHSSVHQSSTSITMQSSSSTLVPTSFFVPTSSYHSPMPMPMPIQLQSIPPQPLHTAQPITQEVKSSTPQTTSTTVATPKLTEISPHPP